MADYDSGLPIRSEADGTDERVHVKIVDGTNPAVNQTTVDSDSNLHVEIHGNDPAGVDRVVRTSEIGALTPDGVYDATDNTKPGNVGLIASVRDAAPGDTTQTQRLTSVTNGDKRLLDVSIHDEDGAVFSEDNPFPVTVVDAEGTEVSNYQTSASVAANASVNHDYTVAGTDLKLQQIFASGSGKIKVEVRVGPTLTLVSKFVGFNSTANPNIEFTLKSPITVPVGDIVRVVITNRDNQPQDVYSTVVGYLKL